VLRALGKLDPDANANFKDITRRDWYYGAAGSAVCFRLISGYEDNTFRGGLQVVSISARTLRSEMGYGKLANPSGFLYYGDRAAIADWTIDDIALATRENLVLKRSDHSFNPDAYMARGDAAIIVKRLFDKIW